MEKQGNSKVHQAKAKSVNELADKISNARTLMVVSVKGLPSKQFQGIKKSIREQALVKVSKKNMILRAFKSLNKKSILGLEEHIQENCALAISDIEGYELAGILSKKKTPVFAKAGQIANNDIEVEAGPTDLIPGPAISELGSLGIKVSVEEGKISIKEPRVIIKKDEAIKEVAASILQKLNIQPFEVGLQPVVIYDIPSEKIYTEINIDVDKTTKELVSSAGKALGFAQNIFYYCKETIGYLLAKANSQALALDKSEEKPAEEKKEEKAEVKEEKPAEEKKEAKGEEKPAEEKKEEVKEEKPAEEKAEAKEEEKKEEKSDDQLNTPEEKA